MNYNQIEFIGVAIPSCPACKKYAYKNRNYFFSSILYLLNFIYVFYESESFHQVSFITRLPRVSHDANSRLFLKKILFACRNLYEHGQ